MWYLIVSIPDLCTLTYFILLDNVYNSNVCKKAKYLDGGLCNLYIEISVSVSQEH